MIESSNIFATGGNVQAAEGLYIVRKSDDILLEHCRSGHIISILLSRQIGKSSLILKTAERLNSENIAAIVIDISMIGKKKETVNPDQWYFGFLGQIAYYFDLKTDVGKWWQKRADISIPQRFRNFFLDVLLEEISNKIVVFVDEVDSTRGLNYTDDFFAIIRELYQSRPKTTKLRRLSFVLVGSSFPEDLIHDSTRTPFNIGIKLDLDDFTYKEALPLARGLELEEKHARQVFEWIMKWTNGHPYLTQRLASAVARKKKEYLTELDVDNEVASIFNLAENDSNISYVRKKLIVDVDTAERNKVLTTYLRVLSSSDGGVEEDLTHAMSYLLLSGVVVRRQNRIFVRNLIYRKVFSSDWVKKEMPFNWKKALRIASYFFIGIVVIISIVAFIGWERAELSASKAKESEQEARIQTKIAKDAWAAATKSEERAVSNSLTATREAERAKAAEEELKNRYKILADNFTQQTKSLEKERKKSTRHFMFESKKESNSEDTSINLCTDNMKFIRELSVCENSLKQAKMIIKKKTEDDSICRQQLSETSARLREYKLHVKIKQ